MLKRTLSLLVCLFMLAVMLGVGACSSGGREDVDIRGVVGDDFLRVRKYPSLSAEMVAVLKKGQEVTILAEENGFYQIIVQIENKAEDSDETVEGYVKMECIFITQDARTSKK